MTLLDNTAWLGDVHKMGCSKCATFLNRSKVTPYPRRPIQMLGEDQMPSFVDRERSIAHGILRNVLAQPEKSTFVAFLGREHLISVSRQMLHFLNHGDSFMGYQRPP